MGLGLDRPVSIFALMSFEETLVRGLDGSFEYDCPRGFEARVFGFWRRGIYSFTNWDRETPESTLLGVSTLALVGVTLELKPGDFDIEELERFCVILDF